MGRMAVGSIARNGFKEASVTVLVDAARKCAPRLRLLWYVAQTCGRVGGRGWGGRGGGAGPDRARADPGLSLLPPCKNRLTLNDLGAYWSRTTTHLTWDVPDLEMVKYVHRGAHAHRETLEPRPSMC